MDPDAIALSRELADRSPSERQAYYVQRDVPLAIRDEVESLLLLTGATSDAPAGDVARATEHVLAGRGHRDAMATSPPEPMSIGRYEVLRLLGRGGMGEVHFARDPVLDRNVAVKLIARDVDDDAARKRLVREARAAGRLQHPNIVTIFDAGEHDGRSYIAMEYVPGETLRSLIRRRAPLPLRRRLELIEGACAGLAHAHRAGVVHLDIKPDNLMLDETGVVKVLDFGIARVLQGDALATRNLSGTLSYMSPEQIAGKSLDRRSDVFSLGCSSFELLAYWPAYAGSTQEIVTRITVGPVPRLLDACPDIDPRLDAIIGRAMAVDPADRYDDLEELRVELSRLRGDIDPVDDERFVARSTVVIPENMPSRVSTPSHRKSATQRPSSAWRSPLAASIVAVAAVTAGAGAFWMWGAKPTPETTPAAAVPVPTARPESARPVGRTEPNATGVSDEVWRRLAAGDRAGVLALLRPVAADRTGTPDVRLPYDVLGAVRTSVLRTRAATPAPGARSSASYRSAELRLARADRLEADGRPVEALGALWQAADLYSQATALGQRQPSRPSDRTRATDTGVACRPGWRRPANAATDRRLTAAGTALNVCRRNSSPSTCGEPRPESTQNALGCGRNPRHASPVSGSVRSARCFSGAESVSLAGPRSTRAAAQDVHRSYRLFGRDSQSARRPPGRFRDGSCARHSTHDSACRTAGCERGGNGISPAPHRQRVGGYRSDGSGSLSALRAGQKA